MTLTSACTARDGSLVAVGDVGTLLVRREGRWFSVQTQLDDALDSVACCPDGRVIAVGAAGVVLTMRDGRVSRTLLGSPLRTVHCAQDNTVVIADSTQRVHVGRAGSASFVSAATPERFVSLSRVGAYWFAGGLSGRVFRASDPTQPWNVIASAARPILSFASAGTIIVAVGSQGTALRSTDGGQQWSLVDVGRNEDWLFVHHDGSHFRVVGTGASAHRSSDGVTWTVEPGALSERVRAIARDGARLVAVGDHGSIATLTERGWIDTPQIRTAVFALHATDARRIGVGRSGTFFSQLTIGGPWMTSATGVSEDLRALSVSPHAILAVGDGGVILRSTDGGNTWQRRVSHTDKPLYAVWSDDRDHALVTGEGSLLRSTDGGDTWALTPLPDRWVVRTIAYDGQWLWIGGDGARLIRSRDFGANWEPIPLPRTLRVQRILHRPGRSLLLFTKDNVVLERIGDRWVERPAPSEILFNAALAGASMYAIGVAGTIYRADNRTLKWTAVPRLTNEGLATISVSPSGAVYVGGEFGTILSYR
jgi:photosystem II stability/assembly factor-like uncharacterized protein